MKPRMLLYSCGVIAVFLLGMASHKYYPAIKGLVDTSDRQSDEQSSDDSSDREECDKEMASLVGDRRIAISHSGLLQAEISQIDGADWLSISRVSDGTVIRKQLAPQSAPIYDGKNLMEKPRFSLDVRVVYFLAPIYGDSEELYALNIESGALKNITSGLDVIVIPRGEYSGMLLVQRLQYYLGGGSLAWYWLVDPKTSKVINIDSPIGGDYRMFWDLYVCQ